MAEEMNNDKLDQQNADPDVSHADSEMKATAAANTAATQASDQAAQQKQWFVVHAMSSCEMRVKRALTDRIKQYHMEDFFGEILVPSEEVMELRGGQKKLIERKIFPGYVLVEMVMTDETWHFVRHIPSVLGFIGGHSGKAAPISRKDVDNIMHRVEEGAQAPKPKVLYEPGEVVRVVDGPFADFNGVVEEVNYEKNRLRVAVLIFGRSTPVELEFSQVEKG